MEHSDELYHFTSYEEDEERARLLEEEEAYRQEMLDELLEETLHHIKEEAE